MIVEVALFRVLAARSALRMSVAIRSPAPPIAVLFAETSARNIFRVFVLWQVVAYCWIAIR